jgi:uncharacterized protein
MDSPDKKGGGILMLKRLHARKGVQLLLGLLMGICFGFFLQRGGVTRYDVILNQLLLRDWTVVKVMGSAAATGMIGVELLRMMGLARLHRKPGSIGATVIGGLIFGAGFALLGYCPGTMMGAAGQGNLDALIGGIPGMLAGAAVYAALYPRLKSGILEKGGFGGKTLPELLRLPRILVVAGMALLITAAFYGLEQLGY